MGNYLALFLKLIYFKNFVYLLENWHQMNLLCYLKGSNQLFKMLGKMIIYFSNYWKLEYLLHLFTCFLLKIWLFQVLLLASLLYLNFNLIFRIPMTKGLHRLAIMLIKYHWTQGDIQEVLQISKLHLLQYLNFLPFNYALPTVFEILH